MQVLLQQQEFKKHSIFTVIYSLSEVADLEDAAVQMWAGKHSKRVYSYWSLIWNLNWRFQYFMFQLSLFLLP